MPTSSSTKRRVCARCKQNRALRFFKPRGRVCLPCQRGSRKTSGHERRVQRTYGLLPGEYEVLNAAQEGLCAICRQPRNYRLNVDHDHKLLGRESVRGLLCRRCNKLLAIVGDSSFILDNAANYLERPPARRLLEH